MNLGSILIAEKLVNQLIAHVRQALRVQHTFQGVTAQRDAALAVLSALNEGVLLVDRAGQVVFSNDAANVMFAKNDGLSRRRRRLVTAKSWQTRALDVLIGNSMSD